MSRLSKVTVVTVNYDNLDDLIKTLDSADNQKVKPKKHIIVTKKLHSHHLKKLKKKYRKFIVGKDSSLYNAMNIGKKLCINSPVIFLNGGDVFYNSTSISLIQKYYKSLTENKVVVFKTILVNRKDIFYPKIKFFKKKNYLPHSSFIFFNSKYNSDINFDEKMIIAADGKWMREILKKSNGLVKVNHNLVIQNLDGQSSNPSIRSIYNRLNENILSGLKEILKFFISLFLSKKFYFRIIYFNKYNL